MSQFDAAQSFITANEFDVYRSMVQRHFDGNGVIIDAGCFLGSTTLAFCEGLARCAVGRASAGRIIAIDKFIASDAYVLSHFLEHGIDIRFGESFLPLFLRNLQSHVERVEVRAGDLLHVGRIDEPISILGIDIAKSQGLNAYILRQWFPRLVPGKAVVIQQDFYTPSQPWIPVSMSALVDYVDIEIPKAGESAVFKLRRMIPRSQIDRAASITPWSREGIAALDVMIAALPDIDAAPLRLSQAMAHHSLGNTRSARQLLNDALERDPPPNDGKWQKWLGIALTVVMPDVFARDAMLSDIYVKHASMRLGE